MAKKAAQSSETKAESAGNPVARFTKYVEDSRAELRKVTWPSAKDTRKATLMVLIIVALMAVVLGVVDLVLSNLITYILA